MRFRSGKDTDTSARESVEEIFTLARRYVVQETLGPLKRLGRSLAFGIGGAALYGFGAVVVLIGVLRVIEEETGTTFGGDWSFVPYLIAAGAGLLFVGVSLLFAKRMVRQAMRRS